MSTGTNRLLKKAKKRGERLSAIKTQPAQGQGGSDLAGVFSEVEANALEEGVLKVKKSAKIFRRADF